MLALSYQRLAPLSEFKLKVLIFHFNKIKILPNNFFCFGFFIVTFIHRQMCLKLVFLLVFNTCLRETAKS